MSEVITQVNTSADNWSVLISRVNQLISILGTDIVTANAAVGGGLTVGNAYVSGILGGLTVTANTIRGGTIDVPTALNFGSNLIVNTNSYLLAGNSKVNSTSVSVGANLIFNTSAVFIGNSTVNAVVNSTAFNAGISLINSIAVQIGNSTVLGLVNSTALYVANSTQNTVITPGTMLLSGPGGETTLIDYTGIQPGDLAFVAFGNSTVNSSMNSEIITIKSSGTISNLNSDALKLGANTIVNTTAVFVGNSTVNAKMNSTVIGIGANLNLTSSTLAIGNSTANITSNSTVMVHANSSGSSNVTSTKFEVGATVISGAEISVGNSTVNATSNSSGFYINGLPVGFTTGDVKLTMKTTADAGWIMMNDGSIGDASSAATTRANSDTLNLFTLLWNNVSDTFAPVSGGRGGSAAADFAAHKRITLTRTLGRALAIGGSGSGLTARSLGQFLGEETHILTTAEMPTHNHSVSDPGHAHGYGDPSHSHGVNDPGGIPVLTNGGTGSENTGGIYYLGTGVGYASIAAAFTGIGISIASTGAGTNVTGSSGAHNVMQPTSFLNCMIKL